MRGGEEARLEATRAASILVVEDDALYARLVAEAIARDLGADVEVAASAADGIAHFGTRRFAAAIVDRRLPDGDGIDVLRRVRAAGGGMPVIFLTADAAPETIVAAMRAGATDYVVKSSGSLAQVVHALATLARPPDPGGGDGRGCAGLLGASAVMERLRSAIRRSAVSSACVLVQGETGVGKELVARALHEESARSDGPFVAVNCGALPEHLVESELFGHVRGAFTGAHRDHPGLVAAAARGSLFLDEVEDLPLVLQGKLLRLLQEGEFRPVGALRAKAADVRVVAASNLDLAELVERRCFRGDLFYRLNVLTIAVPPLRDRRADIPELARHFLARIALRATRERDRRHAAAARTIAAAPIPEHALAALDRHPWPGNVRELGNLVERAFVLALALGPDLGWEAATSELAPTIARPSDRERVAAPLHGSSVHWRGSEVSERLPSGRFERDGEGASSGAWRSDAATELRGLLDRHRWRRAAAARELGISRVTLWRRMRRLGLCGEEPGLESSADEPG